MSAAGGDNNNAFSNNIIFTIKKAKLYVTVETFSARDNQKLSKFLSKEFERLGYWNEYKSRSESKNTANEDGCFSKSNIIGVINLFVLII